DRSRSSSSPNPAPISQSAHATRCRLSSAVGHHQIVAMNDLVAATVAEDADNFTTLVAGNAADVGALIGREAAPRPIAPAGANDHGVAAFEPPLARDDPRRQQALTMAQGTGRAIVDGQCTPRVNRAGDPRLTR